MLKEYLHDIFRTAKAGNVREESYYPDLKKLLESYATKKGKEFLITSLPKKTEAGNPDFRILTAKKDLVGYIEAKSPDVENLDAVEESEQLKRYRETFPNVILTNFFEFRRYRNGELIEKISVGRPFVMHELKTVPPVENEELFFKLLDQFFSFSIPQTTSAKQLAIELAKRTRFLRDQVISEELKEEKIEGTQTLEAYFEAFQKHLIASLTLQDFSNLFAQTITYGLFAARSRAENSFSRELAYKFIPHTIGILRDVFRFISSTELPKTMEWIIDDIAEVLANTDVNKIIHGFHKEGKGRDPIVHFYETFLASYDPKEREKRGVYYTPEPVVGYIVRSVHKLLKEKFGKEDGFATRSVTVLDPAAGTLTFPAEAIRQAVEEYREKYGDGGVKNLIRDHILKNFYAFELMMAPYAVGHLKIGFVFDEFGIKLGDEERFNLYLTNTLEMKIKSAQTQMPGVFERTIAEESKEALKVKEEIPIMVIIGNPPYSGVSENKGDWILQQIEDYKKVDGKPLGERKHWLQDDYVKFYRFAQWKIEQAGAGVLGFITNHAWLDNPTFRGMRRSLMQTFDEIYILNLHGSTLKMEQTPEGGKDENVFDIQAGVAITVFIKHQKKSGDAKIYYTDLWGLRERKYAWLEKHGIENTKWQTLKPNKPFYFFVQRNEEGREEYEKFSKITDVFPINSTGILTGRDDFVIDFDRESLAARMRIFRDSKESDEFIKNAYGLKDKPNYKWFISESRRELSKIENWEKNFTKILYRPFDERWIYYHPAVIFWPREDIMRHMFQPNLALMLAKRIEKGDFNHATVVKTISDHHALSLKETNYVFPLYNYSENSEAETIFSGQEKFDFEGTQHSLRMEQGKKPNITDKIFDVLKKTYAKITPEEIFYYIYAILYSNIYRQTYSVFLKTDFPRVPFTNDVKVFKKLAELGKELVELHLLKSKILEKPIVKFFGDNENTVTKREYAAKEERLYINDSQYFDGIESEVWNYYLGGYQVLDKWLKDRKNKILSSEEIKHYCKIATSIAKTIEIQKKIDVLYPQVGKNILLFN